MTSPILDDVIHITLHCPVRLACGELMLTWPVLEDYHRYHPSHHNNSYACQQENLLYMPDGQTGSRTKVKRTTKTHSIGQKHALDKLSGCISYADWLIHKKITPMYSFKNDMFISCMPSVKHKHHQNTKNNPVSSSIRPLTVDQSSHIQ